MVIITGAGNEAFCAGPDVKEFPAVREQIVEKRLARENQAFSNIEFLPKPVIAAIEGVALGSGCEMSLACDIRIVAEDARIGSRDQARRLPRKRWSVPLAEAGGHQPGRGADVIAQRLKEAVAAIKKGVRESAMLSREEAVRLTLELSDHVFKTEDADEGIKAFLEKREPHFKGVAGKDGR